jgi:thioredoxin-related protein
VNKKIILSVCIVISIFLSACSSCKNEKNETEKVDSDDIKESYKMLPGEQQNVIDVVNHWNTLHDSTQIDSLEQIIIMIKLCSLKKVCRANQ